MKHYIRFHNSATLHVAKPSRMKFFSKSYQFLSTGAKFSIETQYVSTYFSKNHMCFQKLTGGHFELDLSWILIQGGSEAGSMLKYFLHQHAKHFLIALHKCQGATLHKCSPPSHSATNGQKNKNFAFVRSTIFFSQEWQNAILSVDSFWYRALLG